MSFYELLMQSMPKLLTALFITLKMTFWSLLFAIVLGMLACFLTISKYKILNLISGIYVNAIRGTPLMVQAFFLYFGMTGTFGFKLDNFTCSVIILALNAGAYLSEIFRSGINAINVGQMEAARSLGLPYHVAMAKIIVPQAIRIVIPSVGNQFIITLKDTSILSVIGVGELMKAGNLIVSRNFRGFEVYGIIAIIYFIVIMILTQLLKLVERGLSNGKGRSI